MQNSEINFLEIGENSQKNFIEKTKEIYISSFPEHERIDFNLFLQAKQNNSTAINKKFLGFKTLAGVLANEIIAFLSLYKENQFVFVLYFAISKEMRNKSFGSKILTKFHNFFDDAIFIYEVDYPIDEISNKRILFYERNGCRLNDFDYTLPPLHPDLDPYPMLIASFPRKISKIEFEQAKNILYEKIYHYKQK